MNQAHDAAPPRMPEGKAIVYCEGAFNTPNGKTAHGLVRRTQRYQVLSVIDSRHAGNDARKLLDGVPRSIPIYGSLQEAVDQAGGEATHLVVGLAPDGGRLSAEARRDVLAALRLGLNVDCGLHDFLSEDAEMTEAAARSGAQIRDIRKPPHRKDLHFFSGKIEEVDSLTVALLGTDSAVGKRTTAWMLVDGLKELGHSAELIGTGQTAWMQGARYSLVLDSLVNDFVAGEIEHAVWSAWKNEHPDVIVLEGQGSLMNPAYPGGFELLAAGRPDVVVVQHAPARKEYDGFPGYPLHPLAQQAEVIEMISGRPVVAVTLNHENMTREEIAQACRDIRQDTGLPAFDVLLDGPQGLAEEIAKYLENRKGKNPFDAPES
ncbi:MAG TPA: DUF1611 domain-containing protein [Acidobacteriota bacterium]|nr:DUF1611 domain-containing protein [Acidobacteriota bacterium]